jgi:hypothetical protein
VVLDVVVDSIVDVADGCDGRYAAVLDVVVDTLVNMADGCDSGYSV